MVNDKSTNPLKGKYTYVGLDIDTTGRRLIDEIVNIAAYTDNAQYSQHIMPLMNLNPGARIRHQIRVINVGCFRMLKSMQTYKVIKTKTEIAALLDFLDWLDAINTKDGIIFVYHDTLKFTPYMMIEAMKKYRLMDRFQKIVKSFVNGYDLVDDEQERITVKYFTLSEFYKLQLKTLGMDVEIPEEFEGDATVRAKLSHNIVMLMAHGGKKLELEEEPMAAIVNDFIRAKAFSMAGELAEISEQEECIKRQSSLRDIFRGHFQTSRYHRRRAVTFRRLLAEDKHDMESLQKVWEDGKRDGIAEITKKLKDLKEEDQEELIELLDSHFDPEKKPVKLQRRESTSGGNGNGNVRDGQGRSRQQPRRRRGPRGRSQNKENHRQGSRSNSRRKRSSDKRNNNNNNNNNSNNNNNNVDQKSGAIRKDHRTQLDVNSNHGQSPAMVSAN